MSQKEINKEYIRSLPLISFDGKIHLVETIQQLTSALETLKKAEIIGFDTETKPNFKKGEQNPTALIQLATSTDVFLIRLKAIDYNKMVFDFLGNGIQKVGISIRDDLKDLKKIAPFEVKSFLDLNDLAKQNGIDHCGVRRLSAYFLDKRVSKSQQVSNWGNDTLTDAQKLYAATDAWICLKILGEIKKSEAV